MKAVESLFSCCFFVMVLPDSRDSSGRRMTLLRQQRENGNQTALSFDKANEIVDIHIFVTKSLHIYIFIFIER